MQGQPVFGQYCATVAEALADHHTMQAATTPRDTVNIAQPEDTRPRNTQAGETQQPGFIPPSPPYSLRAVHICIIASLPCLPYFRFTLASHHVLEPGTEHVLPMLIPCTPRIESLLPTLDWLLLAAVCVWCACAGPTPKRRLRHPRTRQPLPLPKSLTWTLFLVTQRLKRQHRSSLSK